MTSDHSEAKKIIFKASKKKRKQKEARFIT